MLVRPSWRGVLVLLGLCAVLQAGGAEAQSKSPAPAKTSAANADIRTLLQLTGTEKLANQMASYMVASALEMMKRNNPQMPDAAVTTARYEMEKLMAERMPSLMDQIVPIYAKHFTPEDVKGLIAFYRTPLGAKLIRETPLILQETTVVGEQWGRSLGPEMEKRLQKAFENQAPPPSKAPSKTPSKK